MTRGQEILQIAAKYNKADDMLLNAYNISSKERFDAIIIAPTWTPYRIGGFPESSIKNCKEQNKKETTKDGQKKTVPMMKRLSESFILEWNGLHLAWLKSGTCAGNVIDTALLLANNPSERLIFVGAAGGGLAPISHWVMLLFLHLALTELAQRVIFLMGSALAKIIFLLIRPILNI